MDGPPPPRTASRANTGCKIMYTTRIQLTNYGPIEHLDIACPFDSDKPKPIVLARIMREGVDLGETQGPPCGTNVVYINV